MTAVEYVMMYRNTANVELQNFMLALLDALPNSDLEAIASLLTRSSSFHHEMLSQINRLTLWRNCEYGYKRECNNNVPIERSKYAEDWEYYRDLIYTYDTGVSREEAMDCIFRNVVRAISLMDRDEIYQWFYHDDKFETAQFDTSFVAHYASILLKDQNLRDEYFFYIYWDRTVTARYIGSKEYQNLFSRQDIGELERFYLAWELYKEMVYDLFPPQYSYLLPDGVKNSVEVIDPDEEKLEVNKLTAEIPALAKLINDLDLTETK